MGGYVSRSPTGPQRPLYEPASLPVSISKVSNLDGVRALQRKGHGALETRRPKTEERLGAAFLPSAHDGCGTPIANEMFFHKTRSAGTADNLFDERTPSTRVTSRSVGGRTPFAADSPGRCTVIDTRSPRTGETSASPVFFSPLTGTSEAEIDDERVLRTFGAAGRCHRLHNESRKTRPTRHLGLLNLGNTCYANSVIQVLYQCPAFRTYCMREVPQAIPGGILESLGQLFFSIDQQKSSWRRSTRVSPAKFINTLKKKNDIFRLPAHQDAHEFFCYLINEVREELVQRYFDGDITKVSEPPRRSLRIFSRRVSRSLGGGTHSTFRSNKGSVWRSHGTAPNGMLPRGSRGESHHVPRSSHRPDNEEGQRLWIHDLFQGCLVYETRCLRCENVSLREETFIDIPLECTGKNISIGICLFAHPELLTEKERYFCEVCGCLQEAERRVRFRRLPRILTIHLKRFKFDEASGGYARVSKRVEFPQRLIFPREVLWDGEERDQKEGETMVVSPNAHKESENWQRLEFSQGEKQEPSSCYDLFGVVVHIGTTICRGHYVCCVNCHGDWFLFDDHIVKKITPEELCNYFGSASDPFTFPSNKSAAECGYLLFYERPDTTSLPIFQKSM